jgi:hypothetical protein
MDEFSSYRVADYFEMTDWYQGFDMAGVSVSTVDQNNGSPKLGDKIARHPMNYNDLWLISEEDFRHNYRPL